MESIVKAFYHLRMAQEYFEDVKRSADKDSVLSKMMMDYSKRCRFIESSFTTSPAMPGVDMSGFKKELNGDILFHEELSSLCLRLNEQQKESLTTAVKSIIAGEQITLKVQ